MQSHCCNLVAQGGVSPGRLRQWRLGQNAGPLGVFGQRLEWSAGRVALLSLFIASGPSASRVGGICTADSTPWR